MLRNYLAAALRNLARNRLYAGINLLGLAVGFAAAILIALYVRDELTFDRFWPGHEQVYRLAVTSASPQFKIPAEFAPPELAAEVKAAFPQVEAIARLWLSGADLKHGNVELSERVMWADAEIFKVLQFQVVAGDLPSALEQPNEVVLTRTLARKYFGRKDPIDETLTLNRQHPLRVVAVIEDLPSNTHFDLGVLLPARAAFSPFAQHTQPKSGPNQVSFSLNSFTYLRLKAGASAEAVLSEMPALMERALQYPPELIQGLKIFPLPIAEIHMTPSGFAAMKPSGNMDIVYTVSGIGLLIVLMASINFVNLMTARATRRSIEVGVRKASGANRFQLAIQFTGESLIYVALGAVLAVALVEFLLPFYNAFLERSIKFDYWHDPMLLGGLVAMVLIVGVLAGSYPAFILSGFRPVSALREKQGRLAGSSRIRQALVIVQFAILIGLMVATVVVHRQTEFGIQRSLRLQQDQVLFIRTQCSEAFKNTVRALPGVKGVVCSFVVPIGTAGFSSSWGDEGKALTIHYGGVDFGFFEFFGIPLLAGRDFSIDHPGDTRPVASGPDPVTDRIVINEAAVRAMGLARAAEAIGKTIRWRAGRHSDERTAEVIGVVADFPTASVRTAIEPMAFYIDPGQLSRMSVRIAGNAIPETLAAINEAWKSFGDGRPINRTFMDQEVERMYRDITRQGQVFAIFAGVALFIACLGLFGLAVYTAERRTKEIGVRKAMGADTGDITRLLLSEFTRPVLWANLIAWPIGAYAMTRWLDGFAYRIELDAFTFIGAGLTALCYE